MKPNNNNGQKVLTFWIDKPSDKHVMVAETTKIKMMANRPPVYFVDNYSICNVLSKQD
ncbi:hypothetical protein GCM10022289_03930 [Pedobacter jeongneungensis]|uniref:Uncharacterized protein n=1 Tax=Pedobacter jeongneungensis TaxID=947309 RepID=A0ABP8B3U6_9SPHI